MYLVGLPLHFRRPPTLTLVAQISGDSATKSIPGSGVVAGDLAVIFDSAGSGSNPAAVTPAGWTTFCDVAGNNIRNCFHAKLLAGGDIGGTVTGLSGTFYSRYVTAVFHPSCPLGGFAVNDPKATNTSGDPTQQTTASGSAALKPALVVGQASGAASFTATETPDMTDLTTASVLQKALYTIFNPDDVPADQTLDMGDTGGWNAVLLAYLTFTAG